MYQGKYGAVIGLKKPHSLEIVYWAHTRTKKNIISRPITAPYLPWYINPRNFAKRQCIKHSG